MTTWSRRSQRELSNMRKRSRTGWQFLPSIRRGNRLPPKASLVVVSSGDSAAAGCDFDPYLIAQNGLAVNGFASTPYNVAVGGKMIFTSNAHHPPSYRGHRSEITRENASALSYTPERARVQATAATPSFAQPCGLSGVTPATAPVLHHHDDLCGEGSPSLFAPHWRWRRSQQLLQLSHPANYPTLELLRGWGYAKPDWQSGVQGIPSDNVRHVPDVSFFASLSHLRQRLSLLHNRCRLCADLQLQHRYRSGIPASGGTSFWRASLCRYRGAGQPKDQLLARIGELLSDVRWRAPEFGSSTSPIESDLHVQRLVVSSGRQLMRLL